VFFLLRQAGTPFEMANANLKALRLAKTEAKAQGPTIAAGLPAPGGMHIP
jgi:hypothetical protein